MSNEELVAVIQAGAEERMGELWEQVKGLVAWKARHIMTALDLRGSPCGVELEDLMQSGYIAMVEAVHYYTPESGAAFSMCLINRLKTVFAEATGYRTKRGQNEPLNNSFSLDKTVDDESDGTPFGEFAPDPKAAATMLSIEEKLWREQLHEALEAALAAICSGDEQTPATNRKSRHASGLEVWRVRFWKGLRLAVVFGFRPANNMHSPD